MLPTTVTTAMAGETGRARRDPAVVWPDVGRTERPGHARRDGGLSARHSGRSRATFNALTASEAWIVGIGHELLEDPAM